MENAVARIQWTGSDLETGIYNGGLALVGLDDVLIMRRDTPRSSHMLLERMAKLNKCPPSREDMDRIHREVEEDPRSKDIVDYWDLKAIRLSPGYYIAYAEHPAPAGLAGFGISSGVGELPTGEGCGLTFSWDWFNFDSAGRAVKLQEEGVISIERESKTSRQEVTRMRFETDVSLRISMRGQGDPLQPRWRINVAQGSEIWWPTIVEGRHVATGFVSSN